MTNTAETDVYLNGREPLDFEAAAVERGHQCERARELDLLAGLRTGGPPRPRKPGPATELVLELGRGSRPAL